MKKIKNSGATGAEAHPQNAEREVEVLYQRLGERWYAFSLVDDEVFMGAIPEEALRAEAPSKPGKAA